MEKESFIVENLKNHDIWYTEGLNLPYWTADKDGSEIANFENLQEAKDSLKTSGQMLSLKETRKILTKMMIIFSEKRDDVAENLYDILNKTKYEDISLVSEGRYANFEHKGEVFSFDSLTGYVEIKDTDGEVKKINADYSD